MIIYDNYYTRNLFSNFSTSYTLPKQNLAEIQMDVYVSSPHEPWTINLEPWTMIHYTWTMIQKIFFYLLVVVGWLVGRLVEEVHEQAW